MANIVTQGNQNNNKSPFDSIRKVKENGAEFWMARELMPLLGYQRWDRVPDVIERASVSCQNAGNLVSGHFSEVTRKTSGRPQQDFELSRYASYLVAMNGDPRKPEIASAQSYFAVKTHQAESAETAQAPAPFQLPQTYLEALKALVATEEERQRLEAKVEEDAPLVSYASAVQASETALDMNQYAKSINWGRNRLFRLLRDLGVIMQSSTLPYQRWLDAGYFEVSQEILGDGKLVPFALVTGKGQIWLKQKIDAHVAKERRQQEAFGAVLMNSVFPTA